jgi:hypothetical protein
LEVVIFLDLMSSNVRFALNLFSRRIKKASLFNLRLTGVTPLDFMQIAQSKLRLGGLLGPKLNEYFEKLSIYLLKMMMHDYELLWKQRNFSF